MEISLYLSLSFSHFLSHTQFRDEWMGRSIIRSCAKLSYSHAQVQLKSLHLYMHTCTFIHVFQAMIEEPQRNWTQEDLPAITSQLSFNRYYACDIAAL